MEFNTIGTIIFAGKCCMHTIIKIAVVSVLALFAIVGVVSISKAEGWVEASEDSTSFSIKDSIFAIRF